MRALETTVWCLLILGALSATQTDAFAFGGHRGHRGDFAAMEPRVDDASKYHAVLNHPGEGSGFSTNNELRNKSGPEIVTPNGSVQGYVPEGAVGIAHPESNVQKNKDQPKAMVSCTGKPDQPGC